MASLHGPAAFKRGNTWKITGTLFNADGTPFDLSGAVSLAWVLVDCNGNQVLSLSSGNGISIVNTAGICLIVVTATQSAAIAVGAYRDELRATTATSEIDTMWEGTIEVRPSLFAP